MQTPALIVTADPGLADVLTELATTAGFQADTIITPTTDDADRWQAAPFVLLDSDLLNVVKDLPCRPDNLIVVYVNSATQTDVIPARNSGAHYAVNLPGAIGWLLTHLTLRRNTGTTEFH